MASTDKKIKSEVPVLLEIRMLKAAEDMFKRGARVPIASALMPIKRDKLTKLFVEVTGQSPITGPLPSDHSWYSSTTYPMRMIQSSIVIDCYRKLKNSSKNALEAEVIVGAYDLYLEHCNAIKAEPLITFVRTWHLIQQVRINSLATTQCAHCHGNYVVTVGKLYSKYDCPLCVRSSSLKPEVYLKTKEVQLTPVELAIAA
jgi:hypothetical protein